MSNRKKTKKSIFSRWGKKGKIADGLSTTFFELKLNSSSQVCQEAPSNPVQETVTEGDKENINDRIKMEAPLHLINVIL